MLRRSAGLLVVTGSLVFLAACGAPHRATRAPTLTSGAIPTVDCAGASVAARDLAAFASASALGDAHFPSSARALRGMRTGLAAKLPGTGDAHDAYAREREAVRREGEARLDEMTKLSEKLLGPSVAAETAAARILAPCNGIAAPKKKPAWCEQASQLVLGAAWDDERSVDDFARRLETLDKGGKTIDGAAAAVGSARALTKALADARDARKAASAPLAHRNRAIQLASGYVAACGANHAAAVALPPLVVDQKAGIRKLTVLVEARPPKTLSSRFLMAAAGATTRERASLYQSVASGRSGSGAAVVVDASGGRATYVFTNRHVVDNAELITVAVENGPPAKAEIVHLDPQYDLAVLRVRGTAIAPNGGLGIEGHDAKDGTAVFATGFPGIVGEPSFQTTKGYVSNERFAMRLDADDGDLFHVQHTAPIDGGSSGGPLTSADSGRLLGINAFKLRERDNAALAVPASALANALREVVEDDAPDERTACLDLIASLPPRDARTEVVRKMLGTEIVAVEGIPSHDYLAQHHPNLVKDFSVAPMRTLAESVAHRIDKEVWEAGGTHPLESCAGKGPERRIVLADGSTRTLRFAKEHGRFALAAFELKTTMPTYDEDPPPKPKTPAKRAPASATKGKKQ